MSLPHLHEADDAPVETRVEEMLSGSVADDIYLAVSNGFWEPEEQEEYESILGTYSKFFAEISARIAKVVGEPTLRAKCDEDDFPEWALGLEVVAWTKAKVPFYLRLEHEDREVPIIVALAPMSDE